MSESIVEILAAAFDVLIAVYAFGSVAQGQAGPDSDLDLAILVPGYADPVRLFDTAGRLSDFVGRTVDLLDFRAATTVMQHQILMSEMRLWARDVRADLYECAVLSEKTALDEARAGLLADIERRGTIYG